MNMDVPPLGAAERATTTPPARRSGAAARPFAVPAGDVPASPPPEVAREVEAAARRVDWLRENGRELHFEIVDDRVQVEVRDLNGRVIRVVPASEGLEIATGGPLG